MTRTVEYVIAWGTLAAGIGLIVSGHKRVGWAVALAAPAMVAARYPHETWRTIRATPAHLLDFGRAFQGVSRAADEVRRIFR